MMDMFALFPCLRPHVTATTLRQVSRITLALLVITGRITMLGRSRWAGPGGSYRPVPRFFSTVMPWAVLFWVFFRQHGYCPEDIYLLAGDDVVVTQAGKATQGVDRFFSSLYGQPVPGLACFTLSLVSVQARPAFPIRVEQGVRSAAEQAARKATAHAKTPPSPRVTRRPGRPPGSTNKNKAQVTLTRELVRIKAMMDALLHLMARVVPLTYRVLDGHFGTHHALQRARQGHLHLIATLRGDAALSSPYTGPSAGRGPHRTYGHKVDDAHIPRQYLKEPTGEGPIQTRVYQAPRLHKEFAQPLTVVLIAKSHLRPQARAHVLLFRSDLALEYTPLVDD